MPVIDDVGELEALLGKPPLPAMLKSIAELDEHCVAILARSPLAQPSDGA